MRTAFLPSLTRNTRTATWSPLLADGGLHLELEMADEVGTLLGLDVGGVEAGEVPPRARAHLRPTCRSRTGAALRRPRPVRPPAAARQRESLPKRTSARGCGRWPRRDGAAAAAAAGRGPAPRRRALERRRAPPGSAGWRPRTRTCRRGRRPLRAASHRLGEAGHRAALAFSASARARWARRRASSARDRERAVEPRRQLAHDRVFGVELEDAVEGARRPPAGCPPRRRVRASAAAASSSPRRPREPSRICCARLLSGWSFEHALRLGDGPRPSSCPRGLERRAPSASRTRASVSAPTSAREGCLRRRAPRGRRRLPPATAAPSPASTRARSPADKDDRQADPADRRRARLPRGSHASAAALGRGASRQGGRRARGRLGPRLRCGGERARALDPGGSGSRGCYPVAFDEPSFLASSCARCDSSARVAVSARPAVEGLTHHAQRGPQLAAVLEAQVLVLGQAALHHLHQDARHLGRPLAQGLRLLVDDLVQHGRSRLRVEGLAAREQLVEHAARREDVGARVHPVAQRLLGRHVVGSSQHDVVLGHVGAAQARQAEVHDLHLARWAGRGCSRASDRGARPPCCGRRRARPPPAP